MLIAVDTNVLLDQAVEDEDVIDAIATIKRRIPSAAFIVTQTVLGELAWAVDNGEADEREAALKAITSLEEWGYQPMDVVPVGRGIVEQISFKLRSKGIIPDEEENDASILAEAALLGCGMLLTSDGDLVDGQRHPLFRSVLRDAHVDGADIAVAKPRTIATRFDGGR